MSRQQNIVKQQLNAMGLSDSNVTLCIHDRIAELERKALIKESIATTNSGYAEELRKEASAIKTSEIRTVKASDLVNSRYIGFLGAQNSNGKDIWIAPERGGKSDLVLIDDINRQTIEKMKSDGLKPACIVETSPGNYQGWLRIEGMQASPESRSAIARQITKEYGADVGSVGRDHLGRLAGFTNRKSCHEQLNGVYPFARIYESTGATIKASDSPKVREILQGAVDYLREQKMEQDRLATNITNKGPQGGMRNIDKWWEITQEKITQKAFKNYDTSAVDFSLCKMAFAHGATREQVADALLSHSPDIEVRKAGHVDDYIQKTLNNAYKSTFNTPPESLDKNRDQPMEKTRTQTASLSR